MLRRRLWKARKISYTKLLSKNLTRYCQYFCEKGHKTSLLKGLEFIINGRNCLKFFPYSWRLEVDMWDNIHRFLISSHKNVIVCFFCCMVSDNRCKCFTFSHKTFMKIKCSTDFIEWSRQYGVLSLAKKRNLR